MFFGQKTLLVKQIEEATNSVFSQPNEAAFVEICDHVKMDPDGPKTALKVLIKQLKQSAAKDLQTAHFTLNLLDMCVKNCGYPFLLEFCRGDYLKNLKNVVETERCDLGTRNRVLSLIKVCGLALSDHADLQPFSRLYQELLHKSYRFPEVETNDVNLLKRTVPPLQLSEAQSSATPSATTTDLMQAIHQDLHLAFCDLRVFEALLQDLARIPSDSTKRIQSQNVADRLQGHEKILRYDIQLLRESMDQNSKEQTTLDELLQLIGKIRDAIQQFQSLGRMHCQEKKEEATVGRSSGQTSYASAAAAATMAEPSGAEKSCFSTTTTTPTQATNPAESRLADANDISRTLEEPREAIQLFRTLQKSINTSSVHVLDGSQLQDLQVVAERLKAMQEKVQSLINAVVGGCSADITEDVETALADLISVNDELLHCIKTYQRTAETDKLQVAGKLTAGARTFEAAVAAATSTAPAGADILAGLTAITHLTDADDVQQTLLEATEALRQFNALQQNTSSSSAQVADPARLGDLKVVGDQLGLLQQKVHALINAKVNETSTDVADGAETALADLMSVNDELLHCIENHRRMVETDKTTLGKSSWQTSLESEATAVTVSKPSGARKPWPATTKTSIKVTNPADNQLAEASYVSQILQETREALQLFDLLQQDVRSSSSQGVDAKQMRDLQVVAERLKVLQKKVQSFINGELSKCSADITGDDETALANLMSVNDDLQRCIEGYRQTGQRDASGPGSRPQYSTTFHASNGTGNMSGNGHFMPNTLESATETTNMHSAGPSKSVGAQLTDQFAEMKMQDSPMQSLPSQGTSQHPAEGGPTEPSVDELKVIISRLVERVTTNAKDLGYMVENATTSSSPATSHEFSQIQCLSTTVQDDYQKLQGLQVEYEHLVNANGSSDVDPLLTDLYVVLSDVDAVLAFSKAFLEASASALHPEGAHDPAIDANTQAARGQAVSGKHESTARVGSGTRPRLGSTVLSTSTDSDARVQSGIYRFSGRTHATMTTNVSASGQFASHGLQLGTEAGQRTGDETVSVVPSTSDSQGTMKNREMSSILQPM